MTYIREPGFWVAVVIVALVVNWVWTSFIKKGGGKIV